MELQCRQGMLQGTVSNGLYCFYDIPYGTFQGRWRKVGKPPVWSGVRRADRPGVVFPQTPGQLTAIMGSSREEKNQSEDAFRLNIWTSGMEKKKPVVVWIHGGAFLTGGGSLAWYHGEQLAKRGDVVVVTVNYRLGVLGHLYLPELSEENLAFQDLLAALRWIQENIGDFGGDSQQITLAGQSAGAWYTVALLGCQEAKGLFQKAALFSHPGGILPLSHQKAEKLGRELLKAAKVSSVEELKALLVEQLLQAQAKVASKSKGVSFVPTVDENYVWPELTQRAVAISGGTVALYSGSTSEESAAFVAPMHRLLSWVPIPLVYQVLKPFGNLENPDGFWKTFQQKKYDNRYHRVIDLSSRLLFTEPARQLSRAMAQAGSQSFVYQFTYPSQNPWLLSCHCIDLPFLFGNLERWQEASMLQGLHREGYETLSREYQQSFLHFVRTGNPGNSTSPWRCYDGTDETVQVFGV